MSTNNDNSLHGPQNTKEQRHANRNLRRRTRYAQISPERKQLVLSRRRIRYAQSKRHSNNALSSSQVDSQDGNQSVLQTSDPSLARNEGHVSAATKTTDCTSISEVGSTSSCCDAAENFSSPVVTSNRAGIQDSVASLQSSFHQSEASIEAEGCQQSRLGQANRSPDMQPQSGLTSEVNTETEEIPPHSVKAKSGEGLPSHATDIQGTSDNPSIQEEPCTTTGARCDHKAKNIADLINQPTCIDVNFVQQVAVAFEEVKANQEESTRLAKESICINPSLEPTFLAIVKKHGDITNDCPLESRYMLTSILEAICKIVQELQKKHLTEVDCNLLNSYCSIVRDAEKIKVNVNWLRIRLDEIKDGVNSIVETKKLNDKKNRLAEQIENEKKDLELMKAELEKLKSEIERKENLLDSDTLLIEDISSLINDQALRIQHFENMPLMEAFQEF
ncbi:uncharacterized protein LOC132634890 isoform X2 [Lycium barbarum]|nr:uncharacterized protein LOC132634890 isoform X2 [Lycium barbarum]XP_060207013.1 uncharacterized protein LOC132634890 isoform X2 [Lycium barbarum]